MEERQPSKLDVVGSSPTGDIFRTKSHHTGLVDMRQLIATGIFMWDSPERREQRYGYFSCANKTFDKDVTVQPTFNMSRASRWRGQKVKITAKIVAARPSGHAGDLYLNILPSMPEVGEEIVLGVGTFDYRENPYTDDQMDMGIMPADGRDKYWLDPHILYRLHDQTVKIYGEPTFEPFHPAPQIVPVREAGKAISNGDGTFQMVGAMPETLNVLPKMERIGDGLFMVMMPNSIGNKGEEFETNIPN